MTGDLCKIEENNTYVPSIEEARHHTEDYLLTSRPSGNLRQLDSDTSVSSNVSSSSKIKYRGRGGSKNFLIRKVFGDMFGWIRRRGSMERINKQSSGSL